MALELNFTNRTSTGKQNAFPVQGSESGLGAWGRLSVKLFLRGACHLYFTNRALTGNESLSPLLTPETDGVATCPSQLRRQTFFTDRTLAENPDAFRRCVWIPPGDSEGRVVSNALIRKVLAIFISPIAL